MMILKAGLLHEDSFGNSHSNFVARIVKIIDDREAQQTIVEVKIWSSNDARLNGKQPELKTYYLNAEARAEFYAIPLLNQQSINPVAQAYNYLHSLPEWGNWECDEEVCNA